jgi:hypothetical protein
MTLAKARRLVVLGLLVGCMCWLAPVAGRDEGRSGVGRRYGPTTPHGYFVRVEPSIVTLPTNRQQALTVTVEDAAGQPVDDVFVSFVPSEGTVITGTSRTRGGVVTGSYTAATGSDNPRTAFVIVAVENIEMTVFIDIVPVVFGR